MLERRSFLELRELDISQVVATAAGMCGIWQPEAFSHVTDLNSWEDDVAEDSALIRHIRAGEFTPINVGADGAFQIVVRGRVSSPALSEREASYLEASSEPYLLISNGMLELGGLEAVGSYTRAAKTRIPLTAGKYSAEIYLIDWKAEPGAADKSGGATAEALPDFIVTLSIARAAGELYRSRVETFEHL
jgi:hypothetical protein